MLLFIDPKTEEKIMVKMKSKRNYNIIWIEDVTKIKNKL